MDEGLKFTAKYSRKVQPWNYENIVIGLEMQCRVGEIEVEEAFKLVVDAVETEIDRRLQEMHARERS